MIFKKIPIFYWLLKPKIMINGGGSLAPMMVVVVDDYRPERTAAYGSPVTKGSSASSKIDSTACAS
jgi:hypothetical protein